MIECIMSQKSKYSYKLMLKISLQQYLILTSIKTCKRKKKIDDQIVMIFQKLPKKNGEKKKSRIKLPGWCLSLGLKNFCYICFHFFNFIGMNFYLFFTYYDNSDNKVSFLGLVKVVKHFHFLTNAVYHWIYQMSCIIILAIKIWMNP